MLMYEEQKNSRALDIKFWLNLILIDNHYKNYFRNSHNGVFPKCFQWIRWIQWQKYLITVKGFEPAT